MDSLYSRDFYSISLIYWVGWLDPLPVCLATVAKVELEFGFSGDCVLPFSFFSYFFGV